MVNFYNHCNVDCPQDPFETSQTRARSAWYAIMGVPTVYIDGKYKVAGAASCASAYADYRTKLLQRQAETGGLSPIAITGDWAVTGGRLEARAIFRLVDPVSLSDLRATVLVYEDNVEAHANGFFLSTWQHTTRFIQDQTITLSAAGDSAMMAVDLDLGELCNPEQLKVIAYVQRTSGDKEVYQGAILPQQFKLVVGTTVRSVPHGNGVASFEAVLTNTGAAPRTFTLQPGAPFGDWTADYSLCDGKRLQADPVAVDLGPGEACSAFVTVHTGSELEIRSGGLAVSSSDFSVEARMRVFNRSPSVMLVNGDHNPANWVNSSAC